MLGLMRVLKKKRVRANRARKDWQMKGSAWKKSMRRKLGEERGFCCAYCKAPGTIETLTLDHVIPLVAGGTNERENLALACDGCNKAKGASLDWPRECHPKNTN